MKPRRGNGTPHPKASRPLADATNIPSQDHNESNSPLGQLHAVHIQVAQTLHQIDAIVLKVHKLKQSKRLAADEVQGFANSLAVVNANLQEWNNFLKAAAERPSLSPGLEEQENPIKPSIASSFPDGGYNSLTPLLASLDNCNISCSPLVSASSLDFESPCNTEAVVWTPMDGTEDTYRGTSSSPLPKTPCMSSPPRLLRVLSTISERFSFSTPSDLVPFFAASAVQLTPRSEDLLTPEHLTCHNHLVFEAPLAQSRPDEQGNAGLFVPQTPGFDASPPRTCVPLRRGETVPVECDRLLQTPITPSPFRTPGILLRFNNMTSDSSSDGSPAILDDVTASTVKRLGPRGLEERLWQELALRKADILKSVTSPH